MLYVFDSTTMYWHPQTLFTAGRVFQKPKDQYGSQGYPQGLFAADRDLLKSYKQYGPRNYRTNEDFPESQNQYRSRICTYWTWCAHCPYCQKHVAKENTSKTRSGKTSNKSYRHIYIYIYIYGYVTHCIYGNMYIHAARYHMKYHLASGVGFSPRRMSRLDY